MNKAPLVEPAWFAFEFSSVYETFLVPYFSIVDVDSYIVGGPTTTMVTNRYVWTYMDMYRYKWACTLLMLTEVYFTELYRAVMPVCKYAIRSIYYYIK